MSLKSETALEVFRALLVILLVIPVAYDLVPFETYVAVGLAFIFLQTSSYRNC